MGIRVSKNRKNLVLYKAFVKLKISSEKDTKNGAVLKQNNKELYLEIVSPLDLNVNIVSLDPSPFRANALKSHNFL